MSLVQTEKLDIKEDKNNKQDWLEVDGTINVERVLVVAAESDPSPAQTRIKTLYSKLLVPFLFLGLMISIIMLIPRKVLRYKLILPRAYWIARAWFKRSFDVMGAIFGLLSSSVVFVLLPILIKLDSKGPVLFQQIRIGRNRRLKDRRIISLEVPFDRRKGSRRQQDLLGKPFVLYKFRSMRADAEKKTGAVWASVDDPRITKLGRILRPFHIDEIPQLVNVLRGEMSLVGPRPERPEFVTKLQEEIPEYEQRFDSKPGLTGLAQINCGYDTSTDDVKKKLGFDLDYIKNFRTRNDLRILWDTAKKIATNYKEKNGKPI
jgi:lipopolysaccharide/colanic/teichoic acid biosynthesis glycosyltransferase